MIRFLLLLLLVVASEAKNKAKNDYPIIFVHGFMGWGPEEMNKYPYWGRAQGDLKDILEKEGHEVYIASIGPFASNWDRACELFANIKGGHVDYGEAHSKKFGHKRTGKKYKGLYPDWGKKDKDGNIKKVHLVGHSMGGQTIRMLAHLLAHGTDGAPIKETKEGRSELFTGNHDWVHSITSISSPHQGSLIANVLAGYDSTVRTTFTAVVSALGAFGKDSKISYDAKLDQWSINPRGPKESLISYVSRVFRSKLFKGQARKDLCLHSLSTEGAEEENKWIKTLPNVYYFAFSNAATFPLLNFKAQRIQLPNLMKMDKSYWIPSTILGSRRTVKQGFPKAWQENDGAVNYPSMLGPTRNGVDLDKKKIKPGKWNLMKKLKNMDHGAVVGATARDKWTPLYKNHAKLLRGLSKKNNGKEAFTFDDEVEDEIDVDMDQVIADLNEASIEVSTPEGLKRLCDKVDNSFAINLCNSWLSENGTLSIYNGVESLAAQLNEEDAEELMEIAQMYMELENNNTNSSP